MTNKLFFPYPVSSPGLFKERSKLIEDFKRTYHKDNHFVFRERLPEADKIHKYFQLITKDKFSNEYFGQLLTANEEWKIVGSLADLDNLYTGLDWCIKNNCNQAYFMTNTAGHHADNCHYELFCPLNQLFFITEFLNYNDFFPDIFWVDIDAHFGNGDKKMWDNYKVKMSHEKNNLRGLCFHNDSGNVNDDGYQGVSYDETISETDFVKLIQENIKVDFGFKYLLLFFGTDIFSGDYGNNTNITTEAIKDVVTSFIELSKSKEAKLFIIQSGGSRSENIKKLTSSLT